MKKALIFLMLLVMSFVYGCSDPDTWHAQRLAEKQMKYAHDEKMAQIKAQKGSMTERDKAQLADLIADKVVERLKQEQK